MDVYNTKPNIIRGNNIPNNNLQFLFLYKKVIAEQFTLALLSALTDDDHVNVLRFNVTIKPVISCFKDMLIPVSKYSLKRGTGSM